MSEEEISFEATPAAVIEKKHQTLVNGYISGKTLDLEFRRQQLRNLYFAILDNESLLKEALEKDLSRSPIEAEILEINQVISEILLAITELENWAEDVHLNRLADTKNIASNPLVRKTPYGSVLIMSPWNYPLLCAITPVTSALAAGNTVLLKPSEISINTSVATAKILEGALDPSIFQVVQGAIPESTQLLNLKWDKMMVTGSCKVGKIVATAAAKQLTPVTLELGGKSPVLVSRRADLKLTARRLMWSKLVNSGQTCIAPDYVIADRDIVDSLVVELRKATMKLYPNLNEATDDYAHLISDPTFRRAVDLISRTKGEVWQCGAPDKTTRFFPPTIVSNVESDDALMKEELFLPILPIISVEDINSEAPEIIRQHDHPLALYIFTGCKKQADHLLSTTRSGAAMVNDCLIQGGSTEVPFGGVGSSGQGRYHGKFGFDEFSYERPVLTQKGWVEPMLEARYPPYKPSNARVLRWIGRKSPYFGRTGKVGLSPSKHIQRFLQGKWKLFLVAIIVLWARGNLSFSVNL